MSPSNLINHAVHFTVSCGALVFLTQAPSAFGDDLNVPASVIQRIKTAADRSVQSLKSKWVENGGIELITGGPSSAKTQSRWGHVSLRFVGSGDTALDDTVFEAMALNAPTDGFSKVVVDGVSGRYAMILSFRTLGHLIQSYYFIETRGYSRTILPSTPELRRTLLETLDRINQVRLGVDRYYFFTSNCTSYLSWILSTAGFQQLPMPTPFIPTQASLHFRRSFITPWPEVEGISASDLHSYGDLRNAKSWSAFSTIDLQRIMVFRSVDLGSSMISISSILASRLDTQSTEKVYGVEILPSAFYQRNEDPTLTVSADTLSRFFTSGQIANADLYNRAARMTTYTTSFCSNATAQCKYFDQGRRVIEASR